MAQHVYLYDQAVSNYDRSHGLVNKKGILRPQVSSLKQEAIKYLLKLVDGPKSLLDIGVGHGNWFFIPFVRALQEQGEAYCAVGLDNSNKMLTLLRRNLKNSSVNSYREFSTNNGQWPELTSGVWIINADIDQMVFNMDSTIKYPKFNTIFLMGVLHHSINWRQSLHLIINHLLDPNGCIVLLERNESSDYMDGNFYNNKCGEINEWKDLWSEYYKQRKLIGVPWEPEIRISDYSAVQQALLEMQFIEDKIFIANWEMEYRLQEINLWFEKPVFSNLFRSLSKESQKQLKIKMQKYLQKKGMTLKMSGHKKNIPLEESWKLSIYKRRTE